MKIGHIATYIIIGTVLMACSSDAEPFGEKKAENSFLITNPSNVVIGEDRTSSVKVEASEGLSWSAQVSDYWIKVSNYRGTGSSTIDIFVAEDNPRTTSRRGTVTLSSDRYHLSKTISIEQEGTYLHVNKNEEYVPIAGGTFTIEVESNAAWSLESSANWITTSVSSGQRGRNSITITALSNPKDTERSAILEIYTNNYTVSQEIKITQSPIVLNVSQNNISVNPEGGQFALDITSNAAWKISSGDSWCTVNPNNGNGNGQTNVAITANTISSNRSTTLTVKSGSVTRTVLISQQYATLVVDETPIYTGPEALEKTLIVSSNTIWTANSSESWCSVTQNNDRLTISTSKNDTDVQRTATITVKALGLTKTIRVTQQKATLTLSPASTMSLSPDGGSESLKISSNVAWTVSSNADWCTLNTKSGNGDKTVTINTSENRSGSQRSAIITVKTDFQTKTITVTQANTTLSVSKESLSFGTSQSTEKISISSNAKWSVTYSPSNWYTVTPTSGTGNSSITISANAAITASAREGTVTIKAGEITKTIKISQAGITLDANPTELSFTVTGGNKTVTIMSNSTVTASSNVSWCTASVSNNNITIRATANTSSERTGTITVKAGNLSRKITVTQGGVTLSVSPTELSFFVSGGSKTATVTSNSNVTASSNVSWCTATVSGNTITVRLSNNTNSDRTGTVTIKAGDFTRTIKVIQEGVTLSVSPTQLSFSGTGGSQTVTVTSNTYISATSNVTWCTTNVSGNTITIKTTPTNTISERTATITVKAGDFSKSVRITQSGGTNINIDDYPDDTNMN